MNSCENLPFDAMRAATALPLAEFTRVVALAGSLERTLTGAAAGLPVAWRNPAGITRCEQAAS